MKLTIVAGTRPNFIKIAPLIHEIDRRNAGGESISYRLVHTGQHYDDKLSKVFFEELSIPQPDINLEAGSGTQAIQTANIMVAFERELIAHLPDMVVVVGDVNSTMACAVTAKKMRLKLVHIEAGIRSYDRNMPEEINRLVTDSITDYFFTTTDIASNQLKTEGIDKRSIFMVGNIMIDTLAKNISLTEISEANTSIWPDSKSYLVMTLHRPDNVDDVEQLSTIIKTISASAGKTKIVFPVHPRTRQTLDMIEDLPSNLILTDPLSYLEFIHLVKQSKGVITDSGGIQEETTFLGIPCVTLRTTTERPETIFIGTNILCGDDMVQLASYVHSMIYDEWKKGGVPDLWDGNTAERIITKLLEVYER